MKKEQVTKKVLKVIFTFTLLVTFFVGPQCLFAASDSAVLNISEYRAPESLDPVVQWVRYPQQNMFVPLVGFDLTKMETYPRGATSWEVSEDGLTWTFNIRKNWKWSDGKPVTAHDFEYSFKQNVNPASASVHAWRLYIIKNAKAIHKGEMDLDTMGVKALDDHTLQIITNSNASWFLSSLGSTGFAVPKWAREKHGVNWTRPENIVVCGPYKLVELKPNNAYILEKNPSYYDADKVQIKKVNYYIIPSLSTSMAMYENGELDLAVIPPEDADRIKNDPKLSQEYVRVPRLRVNYYAFNSHTKPFDNQNVRQAFALAIDKKTLVEAITRGGEIPAYTLTPPGAFGHFSADSGIGLFYNPELAQQKLAKAGYPDGKGFPPVTLGYRSIDIEANIAQALQQMWKQTLGVTVKLTSVEGGGYGKLARSGTYNISSLGWGMDYPDANNIHAELFHSSVGHKSFPVIPAYDKVIDQGGGELDGATRMELYRQAETLLVQENAGIIPLFYRTSNYVVSPRASFKASPPIFHWEFWNWTKK